MQRKNNLLIHSQKNGFPMIMAVVVVVVISTIMALALRLSTQTTKKTVDLYVYEQAILLSKSAAEYALLRISQDNNLTNPCNVTSLNFNPPSPLNYYDINISIQYIYVAPSPCTNAQTYTTVTTPEQNGSVLMDITVSVPTNKNITSEPIRYFRRSIQKL